MESFGDNLPIGNVFGGRQFTKFGAVFLDRCKVSAHSVLAWDVLDMVDAHLQGHRSRHRVTGFYVAEAKLNQLV